MRSRREGKEGVPEGDRRGDVRREAPGKGRLIFRGKVGIFGCRMMWQLFLKYGMGVRTGKPNNWLEGTATAT